MEGTLHKSEDGVWYVRRITSSKDTPNLDVIEKFPLHPHDKTDCEYKYFGTNLPVHVEFDIVNYTNITSKENEPPRHKTYKYAKLKS